MNSRRISAVSGRPRCAHLAMSSPVHLKQEACSQAKHKPSASCAEQCNTKGRTMKTTTRTCAWAQPLLQALKSITAFAAAVLLLAASASVALARNSNPGVIPPDGKYHGRTYAEWAAEWWKTVFSIPVVNGSHPLINGGAFGGDDG